MRGYNIIAVYNHTIDKVLLCKRKKEPYKGLSNFVGGKIEDGEKGIDAAYRELYEETSLSKKDITLTHIMSFTYFVSNVYLEVYAGKLKKAVNVSGNENDLYWSELDCNFFDVTQYAGEGNMGHIIEQIKLRKDQVLLD